MKKLTAALMPLALMAGCAVTPQDLQEQGERQAFTTTLPPLEAANCMARNARNVASGGIPVVTTGEKPGTAEFFMHGVYFAKLSPANTGSSGTVWIQPVQLHNLNAVWDGIVKGC